MPTPPTSARFLNQSPFGFSNVVEVTGGRLVFITGQMALDVEGKLVGSDDLPAQIEQVFKNIETALEAVGADFSHVVKLTVLAVEDFTTHMYAYGEIRDRFVNRENPPASAVILAPKLVMEGALVDIAAIAHLPE
ncbi:RidA family protein [Streptomyces sp. NPDC060006]|uniref:RidA family protein n=1 Tax=unclassified Streptomyces TaxID=2593676 RepID=UPI0036368403